MNDDPMSVAMVALTIQRVRLEAERMRVDAMRDDCHRILERREIVLQETTLELWTEDQLARIGGRH